jgi:SAM-dependent methyltransferase
VFPYACIGRFVFATPTITYQPGYKKIVTKLKEDSSLKFLDLGCGLGQNLRKLVLDGVPQDQIVASDYEEGLIKAGKDFFRDADKLKCKFIVADIFDPEAPGNTQNHGQFDYIWTAMFYHLWDLDKQRAASIETAKFLKNQKGATLLGWQLGARPAIAENRVDIEGKRAALRVTYKHDEESFKKLWQEVGKELGIEFEVSAMGLVNEHTRKNVETLKGSEEIILAFTVTRV